MKQKKIVGYVCILCSVYHKTDIDAKIHAAAHLIIERDKHRQREAPAQP